MRLLLLSVACHAASGAKWPLRALHAPDVPASFDCAMRKAAYTFGRKLMPRLGAFPDLFYALGLNEPGCVGELQALDAGQPPAEPPAAALPPDAIYVSPSSQADGDGDGSLRAPMRSVQRAADAARRTLSKTVVLRGGTHFLAEPLRFDPSHSGLSLIGSPGESAVVSGGVPLRDLKWRPHAGPKPVPNQDHGHYPAPHPPKQKPGSKASGGQKESSGAPAAPPNIWVAEVGAQVSEVPGLQMGGVRLTRARFPNLAGGVEVSPGYGGVIPGSQAAWTPPRFGRYGNATFYTDESQVRDNGGWFERYAVGVGGPCQVYDPPVSYWCSAHPSGGGAFAFRTPSGITPLPGALPHSRSYANASGALFFVWRPARWANWMFEVEAYDPKSGNFTFGRGGNQGARGANTGGDWSVENLFEELDAAGEFYLEPGSRRLFVFHNGSGAPPAGEEVVVPTLRTLLNMSGSQWEPVRDVRVSGISFRSSRYTYMDAHAVPSGGDWALDRAAAVFLQGTEGVRIEHCTFERLDGNGVMFSGYNRNATLSHSDFSFLGGTAIASWGFTNETSSDPSRPGVPLSNAPAAGVDGTDGEHPRGIFVLGCVAREVGLYEKQSSFYFQAKAAETTLRGNVFFNGPRAGINLNDGFGGGDDISRNLVFSTCRESGDHGPFNSWDRQPFLTTVRDGSPSLIMAWRHIHHNFFIDNYSPQENVDNDDGSAYYKTHENLLVYGGNGMKNDYGGHDNHHFANVYAYVRQAVGVCAQQPGHADYFYNNSVVMTGTDVGGFACDGPAKTVVHGNAYYTPTGKVTECKMSLDAWQAAGNDVGSRVAPLPEDETILRWTRLLLDF